jgi:hypothetical protein
MTQSVPDSFSMDELSNMLENAPQEEELHAAAENSDKELTPEQIDDIADEALEFASSKCDDPLVHKVIAMKVIHNMIMWHKTVSSKQYDEGNELSGGAWGRDAGKFQAVMDILCNVTVGPDDFTCTHE